MGFAVTWCAVREESAKQLLDDLGLTPTGKTEEFPESPISMARLDTGWRVIWFGKYATALLAAKELTRRSIARDIIVCLIEEHVMASSSEMWSAGHRKWWLSHEGDDGPKGIDSDGELPQCFSQIRHEMIQAQQAAGGEDADVDYMFEIPLKVARAIVGFKHDEDGPHIIGNQFEILARASSPGSFLSKLFRKKGGD